VWTKTQTGTSMVLTIPDFSKLKRNFGGIKIWGGIRDISLTEKGVFDYYAAETEIFDAEITGEVVFYFPELDMTDGTGEMINPEDIAVVYHWGFSTFIDGLLMYNKSMNGVFMRIGERERQISENLMGRLSSGQD